MSDKTAIKVDQVYKAFKLPHEKTTSLKSAFLNFYKKKKTFEKQHVLKDISFEIKKGEFFGIVGRNGSGKSTLLKLLAGIYSPDQGTVQINGKLTPFIELGVGFNPELTGRENIYLNGALLGFDRTEMNKMYKDIVKFAELEKFMDQKLKNYSSGMQVRLAFSIAIRAKSDILLIDEVLAVGDAAFQTKCFDYFSELKKTNTTVIFVSHDRGSLERFCERGILVNDGEIIQQGTIQQVLKSYSSVVLEELDTLNVETSKNEKKVKQITPVDISSTRTVDEGGAPVKKVLYGSKLTAQFKVTFKKEIKNPVLGITIWQKNVNKAVYATNTLLTGIKETGIFMPGDRISFEVKIPDFLNDGEYTLEPAVANESATVFLDKKPEDYSFIISGSRNPHSLLADDSKISLEKIT